jgi:hypothetical protein
VLSGRGSSDPRSGKAGPVHDQTTRFPGRARPRPEATTPAERLKLAAGDLPIAAIAQATGVSIATVHRYLHGRPASLEFLASFSRAFDARLDWLLLGRGPRRDGESTRWALETAGPAEVFAALWDRTKAGDALARRAVKQVAFAREDRFAEVKSPLRTNAAASTSARTP